MLSNRVLKKCSGLLRIRSCRIARNLSKQGTCPPIRPAIKYAYTLSLPSVVKHLARPIASSGLNQCRTPSNRSALTFLFIAYNSPLKARCCRAANRVSSSVSWVRIRAFCDSTCSTMAAKRCWSGSGGMGTWIF